MAHYKSWWRPANESFVDDEPASAAATPPPASFAFKPMQPPAEREGETLPTRRLHILGMGSIGLFVAYALKQMPNAPPVTLMMHLSEAYDSYKKLGRQVRLRDKASGIVDEQDGYDVDIKTTPLNGLGTAPGIFWKYVGATEPQKPHSPLHPLQANERLPSGEIYIHCLILTVKAQVTVAALLDVKHRLNASSTICLMQNGLGQIDEINTHVFPDPATRPTYLIGILSHGCHNTGPFMVVHAAMGVTSLGIYRDTDKHPLPPPDLADRPPSTLSPKEQATYFPTDEQLYNGSLSARFLLRSLTRATMLCSAAYPYLDLLMLQLEKLSSNAVLNPLTALYDVPNGAMLGNHGLNIVQNMLVSETSLVFRNLPELQAVPNIRHRFSAGRLKELFTLIANNTALNSSSMREDLRYQRFSTEVDYINGYIVRRGQELGIQCACHFMLTQMLKARVQLDRQRDSDFVPFETGKRVVGEVDLANLAAGDAITSTDSPVVVEDHGGEKVRERGVTD
ncbi:hypothetical protein DV736_g4228, partial [Chaetothyriales sp. CBS 134916]